MLTDSLAMISGEFKLLITIVGTSLFGMNIYLYAKANNKTSQVFAILFTFFILALILGLALIHSNWDVVSQWSWLGWLIK